MRFAEHAPRDPFNLLVRRHGLAEIVERGVVGSVDGHGGTHTDRRADGRADDRADAAAAGPDAETPPRLDPAAVRLIRLPLPLPSS